MEKNRETNHNSKAPREQFLALMKQDLEQQQKQAPERPNLQNRGLMLEMQMRVREKEAKRKSHEAETVQMPSKKRCDREERIAEVQLNTYWKWFPLPSREKQAEDVPVEDDSDDELVEEVRQDEFGPSNFCCGNIARGQASPGRLLPSVGVSMMRVYNRP